MFFSLTTAAKWHKCSLVTFYYCMSSPVIQKGSWPHSLRTSNWMSNPSLLDSCCTVQFAINLQDCQNRTVQTRHTWFELVLGNDVIRYEYLKMQMPVLFWTHCKLVGGLVLNWWMGFIELLCCRFLCVFSYFKSNLLRLIWSRAPLVCFSRGRVKNHAWQSQHALRRAIKAEIKSLGEVWIDRLGWTGAVRATKHEQPSLKRWTLTWWDSALKTQCFTWILYHLGHLLTELTHRTSSHFALSSALICVINQTVSFFPQLWIILYIILHELFPKICEIYACVYSATLLRLQRRIITSCLCVNRVVLQFWGNVTCRLQTVSCGAIDWNSRGVHLALRVSRPLLRFHRLQARSGKIDFP